MAKSITKETLLADKKALEIKSREQDKLILKLRQENTQVKTAYGDREDDIKRLKDIITRIGVAYESDDENDLDEVLHSIFTNQIDEDY